MAVDWVEDRNLFIFPPLYEVGIYLLLKLVQNWYKAGIYLKFANQSGRYEVGIASGHISLVGLLLTRVDS